MKYNYRIVKRFLLAKDKEYIKSNNAGKFNEIVTLDSILCKQRYFDFDNQKYIGEQDVFDQVISFDYDESEQIIKYTLVTQNIDVDRDSDFTFCGFDILDYFGDNSWLTNYGIAYETGEFEFTEYGLLSSFNSVEKWIKKHKNKSDELNDNEYEVYAIWRKLS